MKKIIALVRKEWGEVFKNKMVLFAVAFLPLIFTAMPLGILYAMNSDTDNSAMAEIAPLMESEELGMMQICKGLTESECAQYYLLTQFIMLFMMMPVIIPVTIASYSIVGEKSMRTLEPLLATPITTLELLAGKALAAILPALGATWFSFIIYLVGATLINIPPRVFERLLDPIWLLAIFIVGPLLAVASVSLAVMVSSRANDPRVAEQIAGLLVLPVVGLLIAQTTGLIVFNQAMIAWLALGVLLLDAVLLFFALQLFQRETILTRWK